MSGMTTFMLDEDDMPTPDQPGELAGDSTMTQGARLVHADVEACGARVRPCGPVAPAQGRPPNR